MAQIENARTSYTQHSLRTIEDKRDRQGQTEEQYIDR